MIGIKAWTEYQKGQAQMRAYLRAMTRMWAEHEKSVANRKKQV